ncbi:MAG: MBOAT family protein [Candidatus Woesearchaeota archaeon]|nr:MAG: MBOAT family protein [Candidatus Woesearchaeota archaeon]
MLFNSLHFLLFFPIVVAIYFSIKQKYRWILLLIASYYFYMSWKAEYIILIMLSTLVDYVAGWQIHASKSLRRKKAFLWLSIVTNLGLLFAFKYFNFFSDSLRALLATWSIPLSPVTLKVLLPVGISFYTFQTMSYTLDIYFGKIKPEKHLGIFAVYVSFFPQLVAGPIERARNLLPQFYEKHKFEYVRVTNGLKLMLWGFFKKIVIADRLAIVVNMVYNNPTEYHGIALLLATIFFAYQIYCDFSGYSDIAIGAAQVMGFNLMDNFKRPYFSGSISEFWKRWHISLSSWFRDYVYIPLGGNRVSVPRWYFNLFFVFLVSGLWHGANWTFVLWGALHGFYLVFSIITATPRKALCNFLRLPKVPWLLKGLQIASTFVFVNIGWIFFRANNISEGWYVLKNIFVGWSLDFSGINLGGIGWEGLIFSFLIILFMEFVHLLQEHMRMREFLSRKPVVLRWSIYLLILSMIFIFGVFENVEFIYFQF